MPFSLIAVTVVLLSSLLASPASPRPARVPDHLRPLHERVASTLDSSYLASPTIRRLVDEIEASDLIVYLDEKPRGGGPQGTLTFVGASRAARFVRIAVDAALADRQLAALIGHELQHAVEVARATWVIDQRSFADLYRTTGEAMDLAARQYDTAAARQVARQVLVEIGRRPGLTGVRGRAAASRCAQACAR
jgi:hypothetical protein